MNRSELKQEAKKMIIGNKWYLWKPLLIISLVVSLLSGIITGAFGQNSTITLVLTLALSIIESVFMFGYAKYVLEFVRGKKDMDWKEVISYSMNHFVLFFLVSLLVGVICAVGSILLVVPGIIAAIGLMFYQQVAVENTDLGAVEILKKAWAMTNGHKMELFVLMLSFIGWFLLVPLTLGIIMIWLMPYVTVTMMLAYEKLKK